MKRPTLLVAIILLTLLVVSASHPAAAEVPIGIDARGADAFALSGSWVQHDLFGAVWAPRHLDPGWHPYISDEDWDWTADHYGRWHFDSAQGWFWIPGEEWAPTWVAWRHDGGYAGPLAPGKVKAAKPARSTSKRGKDKHVKGRR